MIIALIVLEDRLVEELAQNGVLDSHDFGSGEFNIFVLTDDPESAFHEAHKVVLSQRVSNDMRSAYREIDGENYVILWPPSLTEFKVL